MSAFEIPESVRHKIQEAEEEHQAELAEARRSANDALAKRFGSSFAEIQRPEEQDASLGPVEVHPDQLGLLDEPDRERLAAEDAAARERDIARADTYADDEWKATALSVAEAVARGTASFTSDDLWLAGLPTPREPRALGPIMREIVKRGWAAITDEYRPSVRRHSTPLRVYRSLLHA